MLLPDRLSRCLPLLSAVVLLSLLSPKTMQAQQGAGAAATGMGTSAATGSEAAVEGGSKGANSSEATFEGKKLYRAGKDVLPPKLVYQSEPKYPRSIFHRARASIVVVGLVVTDAGEPANLHIIRSGGKEFDKSALECVAKYRFSPATKDGLPVPVAVKIEVNFQIY